MRNVLEYMSGAGDMAPWLKALDVLSEDLG